MMPTRVMVLLFYVFCSLEAASLSAPGPSGLALAAKKKPAASKPSTGICEKDPECQKDLEAFAAQTLKLDVDLLSEIASAPSSSGQAEDEKKYHELKTITLPVAKQTLGLWATHRVGSGACFSAKLVDPKKSKPVWNEEGLCHVRLLGITGQGTLIKIAPRSAGRQSHAGSPQRLQITYYTWNPKAHAFKKTKTLVSQKPL